MGENMKERLYVVERIRKDVLSVFVVPGDIILPQQTIIAKTYRHSFVEKDDPEKTSKLTSLARFI